MVSDRPLRPLRLLCKKVPIARDVERGGSLTLHVGGGGWCTTVHVHARSTVHGQVARRMSFKRKGARQVGANRHSIGMGTSLNSYVILVRISTRDPHTIGQYQNRRTTPPNMVKPPVRQRYPLSVSEPPPEHFLPEMM